MTLTISYVCQVWLGFPKGIYLSASFFPFLLFFPWCFLFPCGGNVFCRSGQAPCGCWGLRYLGDCSSALLGCFSHLASAALSFMGSANGGRAGTVSHTEWSSGRTTAPANLIPALLAGPCGGLYFVLRVSLTPLTDYLILSSQRFLLFSPTSLRLGYLVRYTVCSFLAFFLHVLFCSLLVIPICSASCTRYGRDLGKEGLERMALEGTDGWSGVGGRG
ncbi:hypothetical protein F5144DRAFT_166816 [Chaetomium tenue]|uniref:Uncharacterized protein n=1 Tax=Chaetomium tenue TaxID=1854479 RepID=A0ACB7PDR2_9PEZI|nr:hypothetical protein F5144DRAFT_166816 [Chaetomium globosum]